MNSDKKPFFKVRLISVPASLEDIITGHSFDCGATGVTEALAFSQPDLTYDPHILPVKSHDMDVYFTEKPNDHFFNRLREWAPHLKWQISEEEDKDWLAEWKKGFTPFQLVGPYWIVPSWCEPPPEATSSVYIDPGMAFGTGTHATTKMASYFVHKLGSNLRTKSSLELSSSSLLDVGTGTAVLAILARKEGIPKVVGIEIDPEARRVARENVGRNQLPDIEIRDQLLEEIQETFDFVVANIIDGVLIQLRPYLLRTVKPGGQLFVTGILVEREDLFFREFIENSALKVIRRIEKDEWVGFWLEKPLSSES